MLRKTLPVLIALAVTLITFAARLSTPALAAPVAGTDSASLDDPKDVEAFMDGLVALQLAAHNIPGAEVAVVKDGKVILVKGYGYADRDRLIPVDAEKTLFRPGSVSKLFVWTAVMQLVEQGKLDLNADVNNYLKAFKIPDAFGKPVTLLNLMTHTPGFEDSGRDLFVAGPDKMTSLEQYLSTHIPARVYPPGEVSAYSNYGAALAGYIVQVVTGMPFEEYVERAIFTPLGMTHSTFRQPLSAALQADMSQGYLYQGGAFKAGDFEWVNAFPAGSLSAPAGDMAKFMIAHLQDGEYNGQRILKAETAQAMHAQAWTPSPEIEGMAHGFYATRINGVRIIQHGGDTALFHTLLMLIPEKGVGLYVSYNSITASPARSELQQAFMDRYFPAERKALTPPADFQSRLNEYAGSYMFARMNYSSPEKIGGLFESLSVGPGPQNTLLVTSVRNPGGVDQWVEVKPGVLKMVGGDDTLVFLDESGGQYHTAYLASAPIIAGLRSPWYASQGFGIGLLAACLILFLTGIFAAPVGLFGPRVKPPEAEPYRWRRRLARWAGFAYCLLTILYVVTFSAYLSTLLNNPGADWTPLYTVTWLLRIALLAGVALLGLAYFAWREKYWSLAGRIHYTLLALAVIAFTGFELYWRLLG